MRKPKCDMRNGINKTIQSTIVKTYFHQRRAVLLLWQKCAVFAFIFKYNDENHPMSQNFSFSQLSFWLIGATPSAEHIQCQAAVTAELKMLCLQFVLKDIKWFTNVLNFEFSISVLFESGQEAVFIKCNCCCWYCYCNSLHLDPLVHS